MLKKDEMMNAASCLNKAEMDERIFVLLGRDLAAPFAIRCWANERVRLGKNKADDPQITEALECARLIEESQGGSALNIAMQPVESSQIVAIGHDQKTNTLAIQFWNKDQTPGGVYHYDNFTTDQFEELKSAESIGKYFGQNVRKNADAHPYRKVSA